MECGRFHPLPALPPWQARLPSLASRHDRLLRLPVLTSPPRFRGQQWTPRARCGALAARGDWLAWPRCLPPRPLLRASRRCDSIACRERVRPQAILQASSATLWGPGGQTNTKQGAQKAVAACCCCQHWALLQVAPCPGACLELLYCTRNSDRDCDRAVTYPSHLPPWALGADRAHAAACHPSHFPCCSSVSALQSFRPASEAIPMHSPRLRGGRALRHTAPEALRWAVPLLLAVYFFASIVSTLLPLEAIRRLQLSFPEHAQPKLVGNAAPEAELAPVGPPPPPALPVGAAAGPAWLLPEARPPWFSLHPAASVECTGPLGPSVRYVGLQAVLQACLGSPWCACASWDAGPLTSARLYSGHRPRLAAEPADSPHAVIAVRLGCQQASEQHLLPGSLQVPQPPCAAAHAAALAAAVAVKAAGSSMVHNLTAATSAELCPPGMHPVASTVGGMACSPCQGGYCGQLPGAQLLPASSLDAPLQAAIAASQLGADSRLQMRGFNPSMLHWRGRRALFARASNISYCSSQGGDQGGAEHTAEHAAAAGLAVASRILVCDFGDAAVPWDRTALQHCRRAAQPEQAHLSLSACCNAARLTMLVDRLPQQLLTSHQPGHWPSQNPSAGSWRWMLLHWQRRCPGPQPSQTFKAWRTPEHLCMIASRTFWSPSTSCSLRRGRGRAAGRRAPLLAALPACRRDVGLHCPGRAAVLHGPPVGVIFPQLAALSCPEHHCMPCAVVGGRGPAAEPHGRTAAVADARRRAERRRAALPRTAQHGEWAGGPAAKVPRRVFMRCRLPVPLVAHRPRNLVSAAVVAALPSTAGWLPPACLPALLQHCKAPSPRHQAPLLPPCSARKIGCPCPWPRPAARRCL